MKQVWAFLLAAFVSVGVWGQKVVLSGYVSNAKSGSKIALARVAVPHSDLSVVTNDDGFFTLKVDTLPRVLWVSHLGFHTAQVALAAHEDAKITVKNTKTGERLYNSDSRPLVVRCNENGEPDMNYIKDKVMKVLEAHPDYQIYMTQGFICRNAYGEIDNLLRGGSDYTACLVGAAVQAEEIQIWTDIDGMHNNDPRFVEHTEPVRQLYFEEAAELAYFGAKILHPTCIQPAKFARVPVRLKNTMDPQAPGTIINNDFQRGVIKAVAARDGNICIQINSSRMLLAYGFLRKVFEIFETYKTSIDMVCTSEVGVSVTIDNRHHLEDIVNELKKYGTVAVEEDMCIICVVGDLATDNVGFETIACQALKDIPVRMISYGGSPHNISFVVKAADKKRTLQALSDTLFS